MNRALLIPSAFALDSLAGDPEWFPHPVRLIGLAVARGEAALRRRGQSEPFELCAGAALSLAVVAGSYTLTRIAIRTAYRRSHALGNGVELVLGWTCLAAANLQQEAVAVLTALSIDDLPRARRQLSRIVGRDTVDLDASEISRALIETLAESACDGIVAPLFFMALGGVPLAMAYKAANTLDSMIGHANEQYFHFGKFAARLDDCANFVPARLTAAGIALAAGKDAASAAAVWMRDGNRHKSPNAGRPEAAMAGALRVSLGGDNSYGGEVIRGQKLGGEFRRPAPEDAARAMRIVSFVTLLGVAAAIAVVFAGQRLHTRGSAA